MNLRPEEQKELPNPLDLKAYRKNFKIVVFHPGRDGGQGGGGLRPSGTTWGLSSARWLRRIPSGRWQNKL